MTRLGTSLPLCRGSSPVRYLVGLFLPWHLPAAALEASRPAIKTAFWNYWETARFGPNPGREPFGARFWQFAGFWAAIKTAFWDDWETARFDSMGQSRCFEKRHHTVVEFHWAIWVYIDKESNGYVEQP